MKKFGIYCSYYANLGIGLPILYVASIGRAIFDAVLDKQYVCGSAIDSNRRYFRKQLEKV